LQRIDLKVACVEQIGNCLTVNLVSLVLHGTTGSHIQSLQAQVVGRERV
jgi:hypothetical protein